MSSTRRIFFACAGCSAAPTVGRYARRDASSSCPRRRTYGAFFRGHGGIDKGVHRAERLVTIMCNSMCAALASPGADAFEALAQATLRLVRCDRRGGRRDAHVRQRGLRARITGRRRVRGACASDSMNSARSDFVKLMTDSVARRTLDELDRVHSTDERQMLLKFMPRCCAELDKLGAAALARPRTNSGGAWMPYAQRCRAPRARPRLGWSDPI